MSVIDTISWMKEKSNLLDICERLKVYFNDVSVVEIAKYLHMYGLYKNKQETDSWIANMEKANILAYIKGEERKLKKEWNGPNIPIFILPSDETNRKINLDYKGRSGLAFKNKLFLFLSTSTEKKDIKSLFIHEYHHVCRLAEIKRKEKDFTIIDSVIMEGLAENAVREKLGESAVATWTNLYTDIQCERFYNRILKPNRELTRNDHKFTQIMFGTGFYPTMLGYALGYYIVREYMLKTGKNTKELLGSASDIFLNSKKIE